MFVCVIHCSPLLQVAHIMAQSAERLLREDHAGLAIKIDALKEPDGAAVGTGTGIMQVL